MAEEKKERKFGDFSDYLDAPEDRRKALAVLKEKLLLLIEDWWDIQLIDHPVHLKEKEERSDKNYEELIFRMQDYEVFMYDYQKDWDLNYQDYGLDKIYENND